MAEDEHISVDQILTQLGDAPRTILVNGNMVGASLRLYFFANGNAVCSGGSNPVAPGCCLLPYAETGLSVVNSFEQRKLAHVCRLD